MANISQTANERSLRSVFVGNIPYDASEEKLKDIFSEAGPVLSFKLVYDRESGKPKGYGFCEYRDQETALSAMRNLNSYELNGRNLRVDTATNERFKEEIKNLQISLSGSTFESPYGPEIDPDRTPEQIAKVVTSLPPEQMFEIAKQMKHCVLTNPNEARNMLLQNPQLAYALLQLLVVMRAVDVQTASSILYKPNPPPMPIPPGNVGPVPGGHPGHMVMQPPLPPQQQPPPNPQMMQPPLHPQMYDDYSRGMPPPQQQQQQPSVPPPPSAPPNFDQRHLDPRLRQNESRAQEIFVDPRIMVAQQSAAQVPVPPPVDPRLRQAMDPRQMSQQQQPPPQPIRGPPASNPVATSTSTITGSRIGPPPTQPMFQPAAPSNFGQPPPPPVASSTGAVPGSVPTVATSNQPSQPSTSGAPPSGSQQQPQQPPPSSSSSSSMNQSEQEKAQLIMQVLSLSDQQINMLPADQRQSILALRQQLQQQNK